MSKVQVKLPGGMSRAAKLLAGFVGAVAVLIGSLVFIGLFTTNVGPDEFAVRQVFLGPNKGIQDDVYGPGMHFVMPGYERLHAFPRSMQLLEFNDNDITTSDTSLCAGSA